MTFAKITMIFILSAFASYSSAVISAESNPVNAFSQLSFAVTSQPTQQEKKPKSFSQYHHDTTIGIEIGSKLQLTNWVQLEVGLQGQYQDNFSEINLQAKTFKTQNYSALANFGKKISYHKHQITPFAQLGINYQQDENATYLPYQYQEQTLDATKLQYGLGLRYTNNTWNGLGVSVLYKNKSDLVDSFEHEQDNNLPLVDKNSSIGVSIDLSF
jgi:hypothetical protein